MKLTKGIILIGLLYIVPISALTQEDTINGDYETRTDKFASAFLVENFEALGGAPAGVARPISVLALDLIAAFEGLEEMPYNDPAGFCTVGYGHLIAKTLCTDAIVGDFKNGISRNDARDLLMADAALAGRSASDLALVDLTDGQYGALTSFVFNFGTTKFLKSTLLKLVRIEAHDAAAAQFSRWVLAKNPDTGLLEPLPGLIARRNCEAASYRGMLLSPFERKVCESGLGAAPSAGTLIDVAVGE